MLFFTNTGKRHFFYFLILCLSTELHAQTGKEKDIRNLLEMTITEDKLTTVVKQQLQTKKNYRPSNMPPDLMVQMVDLILKEIDIADFIDLVVPIYSEYYTQEEIQELLQFYKSPAGFKMIQVQSELEFETLAFLDDYVVQNMKATLIKGEKIYRQLDVIDSLWQEAMYFREQENYQGAILVARQIEAFIPDYEYPYLRYHRDGGSLTRETYMFLAEVNKEEKDYPGALEALEKYMEFQREKYKLVNTSVELASNYRESNEKNGYAPNEESWARAYQFQTEQAQYLEDKAAIKFESGDHQGALSDYNQAIKIFESIHYNGMFRSAFNDIIYSKRGFLKDLLGDVAGANVDYDSALAAAARKFDIITGQDLHGDLISASWNRYLAGQFEACIKYSKRALEFGVQSREVSGRPDSLIPGFNIAVSQLRLGDMESAIQTYREYQQKAEQMNAGKGSTLYQAVTQDLKDLIRQDIQSDNAKSVLRKIFGMTEEEINTVE